MFRISPRGLRLGLAGLGGATVTAALALAGTAAAETTTTGTAAAGTTTAGTTTALALRDLRYADVSAANTLDLYLPARSGQTPVPVVVFVHGGAFSGGDKRELQDLPGALDALLGRGIAVAGVNYRLAGEAPFPAAPRDVKGAIRWLRTRSGEYGLDPARFAVWGTSAGGYLADLVGVSGGQYSGLDDPALGNAGISSEVRAAVSWYGPGDFAAMDRQAREVTACAGRAQVHDEPGSPESVWLGAPVQSAPLLRASDPSAWLPSAPPGSLPPFLLVHGDADCLVPPGQSTQFGQALTAAGARAVVSIVPGAGHADDGLHRQQLGSTVEFLAEALSSGGPQG